MWWQCAAFGNMDSPAGERIAGSGNKLSARLELALRKDLDLVLAGLRDGFPHMVTALGRMPRASANFFLLPKNSATSWVFIAHPRWSMPQFQHA